MASSEGKGKPLAGWRQVATASSQLEAESWQEILEAADIPTLIYPGDAPSFLGISAWPCRLMVPEGMEDRARDLLGDYL